MNILVVVAHPDDESLGAGGAIKNLSNKGHRISVLVMASKVGARSIKPSEEEMAKNQKDVMKMLGVSSLYNEDFPNNGMNIIPQLNLVRCIEKIIAREKPDIVITHHMNDLNNDHYIVSEACQVAVKMPLRTQEHKPVSEVWLMEVFSSTEWSMWGEAFKPNFYYEINQEELSTKITAVGGYHGVIRKIPHPRSKEVISAKAVARGAECGKIYAEAFECIYRVNI